MHSMQNTVFHLTLLCPQIKQSILILHVVQQSHLVSFKGTERKWHIERALLLKTNVGIFSLYFHIFTYFHSVNWQNVKVCAVTNIVASTTREIKVIKVWFEFDELKFDGVSGRLCMHSGWRVSLLLACLISLSFQRILSRLSGHAKNIQISLITGIKEVKDIQIVIRWMSLSEQWWMIHSNRYTVVYRPRVFDSEVCAVQISWRFNEEDWLASRSPTVWSLWTAPSPVASLRV